jgi:hypothetical protein
MRNLLEVRLDDTMILIQIFLIYVISLPFITLLAWVGHFLVRG